jgi:hypothetical protein
VWNRVTISGNQNENGPLTGGTDPVKKIISKFQTPLKFANSKRKQEAFPYYKNIKTFIGIEWNILNNFLNWADIEFSS